MGLDLIKTKTETSVEKHWGVLPLSGAKVPKSRIFARRRCAFYEKIALFGKLDRTPLNLSAFFSKISVDLRLDL